MNALAWMIDKAESGSIPEKSLEVSYLTITAADANIWGTVSIALPVILLIIGGVVWFRRRKK